jgi:hypothetical protein
MDELDGRLLPLRADRMACRALVEACRQAIEHLDAYATVTAGRTRVPALALARLRTVHREWELVTEDINRLMDLERGLLGDITDVKAEASPEAVESLA